MQSDGMQSDGMQSDGLQSDGLQSDGLLGGAPTPKSDKNDEVHYLKVK